MPSSLKKYDGWILFIGGIQSLYSVDYSGTTSPGISEGDLIEVLTPISTCREEVLLLSQAQAKQP